MRRRKFDYTGHPRESTNLNDNIWFYVQKGGVVFCAYGGSVGNPTEVVTMPWRMVRRALADHEKAKERKATEEAGERT